MKDADWTSDKRLTQYGEVLDDTVSNERLRETIALTRSLSDASLATHANAHYGDQLKNLSVVVLDSLQINAIALEQREQRVIALNRGLLQSLWMTYLYALSVPDFLEDILDSQPTHAFAYEGRAALWDDRSLADPEGVWDPARATLVRDLYARSLDFLIYHEIAHHARGHLEYLSSELGLSCIEEGLHFQQRVSGGDLLRFLEFDADHHGLDMMMSELNRDETVSSWSVEESRTQALLYGVSSLVVFLLLDLDPAPISDDYETSHPPPLHRAARVTNEMMKFFQSQYDWTTEDTESLHDECWAAVAEIAELLEFPDGRWHGDDFGGLEIERLYEEEPGFFEFSKRLDNLNNQNRVD